MYPSSSVARRLCAAVLLVMTVSGAGCQAWHIEGTSPDSLLATRPGEVRVTYQDGSRVVLADPVLRGDSLFGLVTDTREGEQRVGMRIADIQQVETLRFSAGRTVGLFAGLAALVVATLAVAFVIGCSGGACE